VERAVEFGALKRKLLDAKGDAVAITAALRGAGGYGKTTLARSGQANVAACRDRQALGP
jgi:hypothetical protein